ncbi:MAG: radical SAM/SPASM domain-containing protein [bacterium]|jgi:radical SAM protein with 4Fe4S-binding SPASM domain
MRSLSDNALKFFRLLAGRRRSYPEEIQIEVTNACNLTCSMCPHTLGLIPQNHFPYSLFEQLIQKNPAPKRLVLTGWGEPLMHPQFFEFIALANRHWQNTSVRFTTNGILLNEEMCEQILRHRIAAVTVSVDLWQDSRNWRPELRDLLHPPSPKVIRNLQNYLQHQELTGKTPLILQMVVIRENVEDIKAYIDFARQYKQSHINLVRMQVYPEMQVERMTWQEEQQVLKELIQYGQERKVRVRTVNRQNLLLRLATHFDHICLRTDDSLYITIDGTCTPCCNLRTCDIGSLTDSSSSIAEIWNSEAERNFFSNQQSICGKCDALFHCYR